MHIINYVCSIKQWSISPSYRGSAALFCWTVCIVQGRWSVTRDPKLFQGGRALKTFLLSVHRRCVCPPKINLGPPGSQHMFPPTHPCSAAHALCLQGQERHAVARLGSPSHFCPHPSDQGLAMWSHLDVKRWEGWSSHRSRWDTKDVLQTITMHLNMSKLTLFDQLYFKNKMLWVSQ